MKKTLLSKATVCMSAMLLSLTGCRKAIDFLASNADAPIPCKMKRMIFINQYGTVDTLAFSYNALGDPVLILRALVDDGSPNFVFQYDNHNRLITTLQTLQNDAVEKIDTYTYPDDKSENISIDSDFLFPTFTGSTITDYDDPIAENFQYDRENRIIQVHTQAYLGERGDFFQEDTSTTTYSYDGRGDLVSRSAYDDKVNFLRTSRIFQFLQANYSLNNSLSLKVNAYNAYGLPTHFGGGNSGGIYFFLQIGITEAWIEYDCSCTTTGTKAL